jgi:predicted nucleotidyltransferase component of viral defense system
MFGQESVAEQIVFRGGTALHKLYFDPPARYSEDIDLVQRDAGPIGPLIDGIRETLDPWLGEPKWRAGHGRFTLYYRFETTLEPIVNMRLKIEINTREHFAVHGIVRRWHHVENPWFSGSAEVRTFSLSELLATKLRALHQRKKGRDLFDLALGLAHGEANHEQILSAFERYTGFGGTPVTRAQFEASMATKLTAPSFLEDISPLLRTGLDHDAAEAWELVSAALISRLPGEAWKGEGP